MTTPLVDAEALGEFLGRAEAALPPGALQRVSQRLAGRRRWAATEFRRAEVGTMLRLAPATRGLGAAERERWSGALGRLRPLLAAADAEAAFAFLGALPGRPPWAVDWATFWLHLAAPALPWWARWVYAGRDTGALPLVLAEPSGLAAADALETYGTIGQAFAFLGSVLEAQRRLPEVGTAERPLVALALVYLTYTYTLAAWRLSAEFTAVLGPVAGVLDGILGIRPWEAMLFGAQSHAG